MRPGTYQPTEPREIEAFAVEKISKGWNRLSKMLAQHEEKYVNNGVAFYRNAFRDDHPNFTHELKLAYGIGIGVSEEGITMVNGIPNILVDFSKVRVHRDKAKEFLHRKDGLNANLHVIEGLEILTGVIHDVDVLNTKIGDLQIAIRNSNFDQFIDMIAMLQPRSRDGNDESEIQQDALQWVMALPEIKKAFELGVITNVTQAYNMVFSKEESWNVYQWNGNDEDSDESDEEDDDEEDDDEV